MARKSNAQIKIELRLKSLGEDYCRLIEKRTKIYEQADEISQEIAQIEARIHDLQALLTDEPEIIETTTPKGEDNE